MGVYCYKLTRAKKRKVWDARFKRQGAIGNHSMDIHTPEFVFTLGGSMFDTDSKGRTRDERLFDKLCKPTIRSWDKTENGVKGTLYVWDFEDGAEVYAANGCVWYDTGTNGELVGYLRSDGSRFRFEAAPELPYRVTFKGTKGHGDREVYVTAINDVRAKYNAANILNDSPDVNSLDWTSMYPKIERNVKKPMTTDEALRLAQFAIKKLSSADFDLSDKVQARRLISELRA